jgi:hypothetical protein
MAGILQRKEKAEGAMTARLPFPVPVSQTADMRVICRKNDADEMADGRGRLGFCADLRQLSHLPLPKNFPNGATSFVDN